MLGLEHRRVLVEPLLEGLEVSLAVVVDAGLVVPRVEDESGVALDLDTVGLVGSGVELADDEVGLASESISELVPDGSELLAVAAPGSVELDEDILGLILDDLLELLADNDDVVALLGGRLLGLEVSGNLTGDNIVDPLGDSSDGVVLGSDLRHELLHVGGLEGSESGKSGGIDTNELGESLLDTTSDISVREEHLALVGLGGLLEDLLEIRLSVILGSEEEDGVLLLAEDGLDLVLSELEDGGNAERLGPGDESILVGRAGVSERRLLELSEEGDARGGSTVLLGAVSISGVHEGDAILSGSEAHVSVGVEGVGEVTEVGEHELALGNLLLEGSAGDLGGRRTGLLENPRDNGVLGSATTVLSLLAVTIE